MSANVADPGLGGIKHLSIWPVLQVFGTSRPAIRVGDVGPGAPDGPDPWGIPP